MGFTFIRKLPVPKEIKEQYPLSEKGHELKAIRDREIKSVLSGEDTRLIVIVGPCSADNDDAVLNYVSMLADIQETVKNKLIIIPRVYTSKPRTMGDGYKGMLHQPDPTEEPDLLGGIIAIRKLHRTIIEETDLTCADELLYPENYWYLADLLSYVTIGARSVEDQQHRLTASGFDVPAGMKNPTGGDLTIMLNAIHAAQHPHQFIYRGWDVTTPGNPYAHAILRGEINKHGNYLPNYHYDDLRLLYEYYQETDCVNPAVIVDSNHANSGKKYEEQPRIVREVLNTIHRYEDIGKLVKGFMIESYLVSGSQNVGDGVYGKSITDPCLGFEETRELLFEIADSVTKKIV